MKKLTMYQYQPLSDSANFRLFLLQPSLQHEDRIEGHIFEFSRAHCPPYDALSYVCGRDDASQPRFDIDVLVDDEPRQLKVLRNLFIALKDVRQQDMAEFFWIDAICINPEDTDERGLQVQHMSETFASARRVLACLQLKGSSELLLLAKFTAHECWAALEFDESPWGKPPKTQTNNRVWRPAWCNVFSKAFLPYWRALVSMLRNEYWNRRWIAQEVVLARKVVLCHNSTTLDVERVSNVLSKAQTLQWDRRVDQQVLRLLKEAVDSKTGFRKFTQFSISLHQDYHRLTEILDHFRELKCKDPRDTIYAMLGIAYKYGLEHTIKADYRISAIELYLRAEILLSDYFGPLQAAIYENGFLLDMNIDHAELYNSMPLWSGFEREVLSCSQLFGFSKMNSLFDWDPWKVTPLLPTITARMLVKPNESDLFLPQSATSLSDGIDPTRALCHLRPEFIKSDKEAHFCFAATQASGHDNDEIWWLHIDRLNHGVSYRLRTSAYVYVRAVVRDLWFGDSKSGKFIKLQHKLVRDQDRPPYRYTVGVSKITGRLTGPGPDTIQSRPIEPELALVYDFGSSDESAPRSGLVPTTREKLQDVIRSITVKQEPVVSARPVRELKNEVVETTLEDFDFDR